MSKIAIIAKLPAAEGKRDELAEAFQAAITNAEGEPGTERYILHKDLGDANVLWVYEMYTDNDALTVHSSSDAFKALGGALGPLMGGRPELILMEPVSGKGL
jgi:quinol monooxygenase YgiN